MSTATASSRRLISSTSADGETSRFISSRAPAAVTVRSMAENTVGAPSFLGRTSSRLARVAASMSMSAPGASRFGARMAGRSPICVRFT